MKNSGIVLKKTDWKSKDIIVEILTSNGGKQSYIIYNAKKLFFSPSVGTILEFIENKTKSNLLSLSEWKYIFTPKTNRAIHYSLLFITSLINKIDTEYLSQEDIYFLTVDTIKYLDISEVKSTILVGFIIKLLHIEGLLFLDGLECENCNSIIVKREQMFYDFENNKKYCKLCGKKGILDQCNSSIAIFINWFIDRDYIDLIGVKFPFEQEEIINFLIKYLNYNFIKVDNESILKRILTEECR